ncbi:DUF3040 domain-containing protein [Prauserella rugosa]|uniref:DUF3040 family protein n=1 Tax=Prauserella rugosa TaxID=43354 RepID=A0A660C6J7_9PSEU|nr:DUF3040 domain-containing protein [Prauserella rugosa]KID28032.1 Protein of unknown function (DUF3040) [Prauserella sp. Am3]KMS87692.1 membrane protein [Streptomyces regensis]TWH18966.1 Protein of unknown function (DUF3040) [Prauserella rugosa]
MPLSEHEQRLLDQIERELYAEDPKFASSVRGAKVRRPRRGRRLQGGALFVLGIGLLVLGVVVPVRVAEIPLISVFGFLVMFLGVVLVVTAMRAGGEPEDAGSGSGDSGGGSSGAAQAKRSSFAQKMEDRLRHRFDDR